MSFAKLHHRTLCLLRGPDIVRVLRAVSLLHDKLLSSFTEQVGSDNWILVFTAATGKI